MWPSYAQDVPFGHQINMEFCSELRKTAAEIFKMLKTLLK
jgi:hypothetical protein